MTQIEDIPEIMKEFIDTKPDDPKLEGDSEITAQVLAWCSKLKPKKLSNKEK
jgi:hypothetical protein